MYGFDYSCIKEVALREPLVDTVDLKAVVTRPCQFKVRDISATMSVSSYIVQQIDLKTAKKEDLTFEAPFSLKAERNDCGSGDTFLGTISDLITDIHAFLSWFDVEFSSLHVPIRFSTGPQAKYTHWK